LKEYPKKDAKPGATFFKARSWWHWSGLNIEGDQNHLKVAWTVIFAVDLIHVWLQGNEPSFLPLT
jgi:hypothetical protein